MYDKTIFTQSLAINRFIYAIEKGLYIEAHELLEEEWKFYKKNEQKEKAKAIQGLINGATALALYFQKNKPDGYLKVWLVFEKYKFLLERVEIKNKDRFYYARDLLIKINSTIKIDVGEEKV